MSLPEPSKSPARFIIEAWTKNGMFAKSVDHPLTAFAECEALKDAGFETILVHDATGLLPSFELLRAHARQMGFHPRHVE